MKRLSLLATMLIMKACCSAVAQAPPSSLYNLQFSDSFPGAALDTSKWNYRTDVKALSSQLPANISVSSGAADINLEQQTFAGKSYTGGGIVSKDSFRYGYYQVQAQTTLNSGWHSSFWLFAGNGSTTYTPTAKTEIDDFEIDSATANTISLGYIEWNNGSTVGGTRCNSSYKPAFGSTAGGLHYYGVEWTEQTITYYIDGAVVCGPQSYPASSYTHDLVNIWMTGLGYSSPVSVANNPSPDVFKNLTYYVRDYYINALEPGYVEYGAGWTTSSLAGYSALPTRYSNSSGAIATWTPTLLAAGTYDVQIWKTVQSTSDSAAPVTVNFANGSSTQPIDFTSGTSGWVDLGSFSFNEGSTANVQLGYSGAGYARTSMVKFLRR